MESNEAYRQHEANFGLSEANVSNSAIPTISTPQRPKSNIVSRLSSSLAKKKSVSLSPADNLMISLGDRGEMEISAFDDGYSKRSEDKKLSEQAVGLPSFMALTKL